jgi:hypothetical protein
VIDYHGPALYRDACDATSSHSSWWEESRILVVTGENPDEVAFCAVTEASRAILQRHVKLPSLSVMSEAALPTSLQRGTGHAFVQIGLCPTHPDLVRSYTKLLGAALDTGLPVVLASVLADGSYAQRFGVPLMRRLATHVRLNQLNGSMSPEEAL